MKLWGDLNISISTMLGVRIKDLTHAAHIDKNGAIEFASYWVIIDKRLEIENNLQ